MKLLVIGSGAREHALCWKIKNESKRTSLYCAPGNAGIAEIAECVDINAEDVQAIVQWCETEKPDLVIVGPDGSLALGLVDALDAVDIPAFGPTKAAAQIEWSKAFMKDLAKEAGIPTARYGRFTDFDDAKTFIDGMSLPIVVKADGLALGKGVLICETKDEALMAASNMLSGQSFGSAGREIVVEEFLTGFEVSYFALVDGTTVMPLTSAQDHKRVGEKDTGPNTGGMGAISPAPGFTPEIEALTLARVIQPFADAMVKSGAPFRGVIFAGLMIQNGEPVLIEFNARFGDPETQSLMCRWEGDPVPYFMAVAKGQLAEMKDKPQFSNQTTLGVVMAAKGYPDTYTKRTRLTLPDPALDNSVIFHAGTALENGVLVNTGGRTLTVVGIGEDAFTAQSAAYAAVNEVDWPEGFCRRDIGWRALS